MIEVSSGESHAPRKGQFRKVFLVAVLAMMCALWAFAWVDNYRLRESLALSSQDEVAHYQEAFLNQPDTETVTVVTVGRDYVLFGDTVGKVDVFIKTTPREGSTRYSGVEIGFKWQGDTWIMTDSGSCSSEECIVKARKAFGDTATVE